METAEWAFDVARSIRSTERSLRRIQRKQPSHYELRVSRSCSSAGASAQEAPGAPETGETELLHTPAPPKGSLQPPDQAKPQSRGSRQSRGAMGRSTPPGLPPRSSASGTCYSSHPTALMPRVAALEQQVKELMEKLASPPRATGGSAAPPGSPSSGAGLGEGKQSQSQLAECTVEMREVATCVTSNAADASGAAQRKVCRAEHCRWLSEGNESVTSGKTSAGHVEEALECSTSAVGAKLGNFVDARDVGSSGLGCAIREFICESVAASVKTALRNGRMEQQQPVAEEAYRALLLRVSQLEATRASRADLDARIELVDDAMKLNHKRLHGTLQLCHASLEKLRREESEAWEAAHLRGEKERREVLQLLQSVSEAVPAAAAHCKSELAACLADDRQSLAAMLDARCSVAEAGTAEACAAAQGALQVVGSLRQIVQELCSRSAKELTQLQDQAERTREDVGKTAAAIRVVSIRLADMIRTEADAAARSVEVDTQLAQHKCDVAVAGEVQQQLQEQLDRLEVRVSGELSALRQEMERSCRDSTAREAPPALGRILQDNWLRVHELLREESLERSRECGEVARRWEAVEASLGQRLGGLEDTVSRMTDALLAERETAREESARWMDEVTQLVEDRAAVAEGRLQALESHFQELSNTPPHAVEPRDKAAVMDRLEYHQRMVEQLSGQMEHLHAAAGEQDAKQQVMVEQLLTLRNFVANAVASREATQPVGQQRAVAELPEGAEDKCGDLGDPCDAPPHEALYRNHET